MSFTRVSVWPCVQQPRPADRWRRTNVLRSTVATLSWSHQATLNPDLQLPWDITGTWHNSSLSVDVGTLQQQPLCMYYYCSVPIAVNAHTLKSGVAVTEPELVQGWTSIISHHVYFCINRHHYRAALLFFMVSPQLHRTVFTGTWWMCI